MNVKFSIHSVRRILIKFYQSSTIKQSTKKNTWDQIIPKFHYDLRPSGTLTKYRLHLSTKIYKYIL
jgi:hypothetical protein